MFNAFQKISNSTISETQLENASSNMKTQVAIMLEFQNISLNYLLEGGKIKMSNLNDFKFSQLPKFDKPRSKFHSCISQEKMIISGVKVKFEQISFQRINEEFEEINENIEKIIKINEIDKFHNNLRKKKYDSMHQFEFIEKKFSNKFVDIEEQEPLKIQFEKEESAVDILNDLLNKKNKGKRKVLIQRYNKLISNCQYDFLGILTMSV